MACRLYTVTHALSVTYSAAAAAACGPIKVLSLYINGYQNLSNGADTTPNDKQVYRKKDKKGITLI